MITKIFNFFGNIVLGIFLAAFITVLSYGPTDIFRKTGLVGKDESIFGAFKSSYDDMSCKAHSKNKEECDKQK